MKKFFKKISDYIKKAAWIQPLLIVIVVFLVLFLLGPITECTKNVWNSISTNSNMKTIKYSEYVEKVRDSGEDDKYVFVFTQDDCDHCKSFYPVMNNYMKKYKDNTDFEIYSINLTTKTKGDEVIYKDSTAGKVTGETDNDMVKQLDERINDFKVYSNYTNDLTSVDSKQYNYVATPLVVWYVGGMEVRISNNFDGSVSSDANGDKALTSFKTWIELFEQSSFQAPDGWNQEFDLQYVA